MNSDCDTFVIILLSCINNNCYITVWAFGNKTDIRPRFMLKKTPVNIKSDTCNKVTSKRSFVEVLKVIPNHNFQIGKVISV